MDYFFEFVHPIVEGSSDFRLNLNEERFCTMESILDLIKWLKVGLYITASSLMTYFRSLFIGRIWETDIFENRIEI